jgi:hypothetical protein
MIEPTTTPAPSEPVGAPVQPSVRQHTPGPWKFELAPSGGFDIEKDPNDLGRYMVIATRNSNPKRAAEMHANARLIAAAPDLLDALRSVELMMREHGMTTHGAHAQVCAALKKAACDA